MVRTARKTVSEPGLQALVAAAQQGDARAFEALYRHTRSDVSRLLHQLAGGQDLEDLIQEAYLQLLVAIRGFRGEAQFRTFLYRVCANVALMRRRWRRRHPEDPTATPPERETSGAGVDPERGAERREAQRCVLRALDRLAPKKRLVFVYAELQGLGPEEIANLLGVPYNTVRSRLNHARREFTAALQAVLGASPSPGNMAAFQNVRKR